MLLLLYLDFTAHLYRTKDICSSYSKISCHIRCRMTCLFNSQICNKCPGFGKNIGVRSSFLTLLTYLSAETRLHWFLLFLLSFSTSSTEKTGFLCNSNIIQYIQQIKAMGGDVGSFVSLSSFYNGEGKFSRTFFPFLAA